MSYAKIFFYILHFIGFTLLICNMSEDIERTHRWSLLWQLPLSLNKCSTFHIGERNPNLLYSLAGQTMQDVDFIRDLGVWFSNNLKSTLHCNKIASLAFRRLALVRKCFTSNCTTIKVRAFCVFVRPLLEYASPVWSPHLLQDMDTLEAVRRIFTRHLPNLKSLSPGERLRRTGHEPLELRRLRADLVLT